MKCKVEARGIWIQCKQRQKKNEVKKSYGGEEEEMTETGGKARNRPTLTEAENKGESVKCIQSSG